ncbi:MAG TPA: S53 family peptidase, partial [Thermoleophilia bacterium]|nr:S53 family peptidase [Thermoleophilia bacterium]
MKRFVLTSACALAAIIAAGASTPAGLARPAAPERAAAPRFAVTIRPDLQLTHEGAVAPETTAGCERQFHFQCFQPTQLERAYDLLPLYASGYTGAGRTIVIVDAFGSPTIVHDLRVFDQTFRLPNPPSIREIYPDGPNPPGYHQGWAGETTLDVEWAHAIAPGANILVVATPKNENEGTSGFAQIVEAENYVIDHNLGDVITQSFGATENTFPTAKSLLELRSAYINADAHHVTVLAASSDAGATDYVAHGNDFYTHPVVDWPGSDPLVTNLGGTRLHLSPAGVRQSPDTVWNDTYNKAVQRFFGGSPAPTPTAGGGGRSIIFSRPSYQNGLRSIVGSQRGMPDLSMSASCSGQVDMYQSYPGARPGWTIACGTSEASPLFAGIVAIADQYAGHRLGLLNPALYRIAAAGEPGIVDVTSGNNTVSF